MLTGVDRTGRGYYRARLSPAGWPYEFVTDASMQRTTADGRERILGLERDALQFDVSPDLARAKIDTDGFVAIVKDLSTKKRKATAALGRRPDLDTHLLAVLSRSETTKAFVADVSRWPASGVFFVGTEAIRYDARTGGGTPSFDTLERGIWDTETAPGKGQAHYVADGAGLSYARITDWPETMEGRRVRVYLYGPGDDPQGDGTLAWIGIASTDVSEDGLGRWKFTVDPLTSVFDQDVGADLEDPCPIRGITYPRNAPLRIRVTNRTVLRAVEADVIGHFETEDLCAEAITTSLAAAIAAEPAWTWATGSTLGARARLAGEGGGPGWDLFYQVGGSGTPHALTVEIQSLLDTSEAAGDGVFRDSVTGLPVVTPALDDLLYIPVVASLPRGVVGADTRNRWRPRPEAADPSDVASPTLLYLGGTVVPSATMAALLTEEGAGDDASVRCDVIDTDATARTLRVSVGMVVMGPSTRIKIGRVLARGSVADLRDALVADSPDYCNSAGGPLIVDGDIADPVELRALVETMGLARDRVFVAYGGMRLGDIIEPELMTLGCYQRVNANGAIEWKPLRVTVETDDATWRVGVSDVLGPVQIERSDQGLISQVLYKTGWDPVDDKFKGPEIRPIDYAASSANRRAREIVIERRSLSQAEFAGRLEPVDPRAVGDAVSPILGLYGAPYDTATFEVGPKFRGMLVGDTVALTHPRVPSTLGTRGVSSALGLVKRVTPDIGTGRVVVGLHLHGQAFAGYAPSFRVTGTALVGGNTWDLTLTLTGYTDESSIAAWFEVGDDIRVTETDTATPTQIDGNVDAINSSTSVRVTFTGPYTPGSAEWCLRPRTAPAYASTERLAKFVFVADTTRLVNFIDLEVGARVIAP